MGEVTVVASQVRGYGVWDGGVAQGGALLAGWKGPAPSLLFLWVSDAQANLLQMELSAIQTSDTASGNFAAHFNCFQCLNLCVFNTSHHTSVSFRASLPLTL